VLHDWPDLMPGMLVPLPHISVNAPGWPLLFSGTSQLLSEFPRSGYDRNSTQFLNSEKNRPLLVSASDLEALVSQASQRRGLGIGKRVE
jgi:hypothetical protein